ncbi:hypothetical protein CDL15_Pgr015146 [Punica granatum]|uniref:Uncharacterized protein n=1 Tax=Punica granatum TaxID=22663 RepID=A0A218W0S6_PUNGR|nr:hypothetical protein CDL15_Pgr015146 [Punica granatum]
MAHKVPRRRHITRRATTKGRQVGGLDLLGSKRASSLRRGTGPSQASSNGDKAGTWTKAPRWHRHLRRF